MNVGIRMGMIPPSSLGDGAECGQKRSHTRLRLIKSVRRDVIRATLPVRAGEGQARSSHEFEIGMDGDHDESMVIGELQEDLGSIATNTMRPRLHCGHWRNEMPVRSS